MNKEDLKIGKKVFLEPVGNAARYSNELKEATIESIGKKYFYVNTSYFGSNSQKFEISSGAQDCNGHSSNYIAHLDKQAIEDKNERNKNIKLIRDCSPTLEQSRKILQILNEEK